VVRVCCRFHFVACCFFKKRPFGILSVIPKFLEGGSFFCNLGISEISSRRPNRERPFCFFTSIF
jgi:hypothetical protein